MADTERESASACRELSDANAARRWRNRTERCKHGFDLERPELCIECRGGPLPEDGRTLADRETIETRKAAVLRLRQRGLSYKEIALELRITTSTVGNYLTEARRAARRPSEGCSEVCPVRRQLVGQVRTAKGERRRALKRALAKHTLDHQPRLLVTGDGE